MDEAKMESPKALLMDVAKSLAVARIACRTCLVVVAFSALPAVSSYAADLKQNLSLGTPWVVAQAATSKTTKAAGTKAAPQASPVAPNATGAEIVGKLL